MTIQQLQQRSHDIKRQASREYIRERVSMTRREMERESAQAVRAAVANACIGVRRMI